MTKQYLLASDFDQTLSFNDSGVVLSELIGSTSFHEKVAGLSKMNLVQQGAELVVPDPARSGVSDGAARALARDGEADSAEA